MQRTSSLLVVDIDDLGAKHLLLGHLNPDSLPEGQMIARLGSENNNGCWFCPLHVQLNKDKFKNRYQNDLDCLDG